MTEQSDIFRAELKAAGITQADFRRLIERLAGEEIGNRTVNRWATGDRAVPALAWAALRLYSMLPKKLRARLTD